MAVYGEVNSIRLESHSINTDIPDKDVARLMYYLYCVFYTIESTNDPNIQHFISYQNWNVLSAEEQKKLVNLCDKLSPTLLLGKIFFQSDHLCQNSSNRFYKICELQGQMLITDSEITIEREKRTITNIMAYKQEWMEKYYYSPLRRLKPSSNILVTSGNRKKYIWICCVCCIVFVVLPIIIVIIVDSVQREKKRYNSPSSY